MTWREDQTVGEIIQESRDMAIRTIIETRGHGWSKSCRKRRKAARRLLDVARKMERLAKNALGEG